MFAGKIKEDRLLDYSALETQKLWQVISLKMDNRRNIYRSPTAENKVLLFQDNHERHGTYLAPEYASHVVILLSSVNKVQLLHMCMSH